MTPTTATRPHPLLALTLAAFASVCIAVSAGAQQPDEILLRGVVRDATTGSGITGAVVRLGERGRAVLTNQDGGFSAGEVEPGSQYIIVTQLGYDTLHTVVDVSEATGALSLELTPDPIVLERVTALVDRFEAHRNSIGSSVRVFDHGHLAVSGAYSALDFLQMRSALFPYRCPWPLAMAPCSTVRGRPVEVRVILDGATVAGGLDVLAAFRPDELYAIEVIGGGRAVRVYTNWFVDTIAEGRRLPSDFLF